MKGSIMNRMLKIFGGEQRITEATQWVPGSETRNFWVIVHTLSHDDSHSKTKQKHSYINLNDKQYKEHTVFKPDMFLYLTFSDQDAPTCYKCYISSQTFFLIF